MANAKHTDALKSPPAPLSEVHTRSKADLVRMARELTDARISSARMFSTLAPAPGVDIDLDIMEAQYRAALVDFAEGTR